MRYEDEIAACDCKEMLLIHYRSPHAWV